MSVIGARPIFSDTETYSDDGRAPLRELDARFDEWPSKYGFEKDPVYTFNVETETAIYPGTVYCYKSARKGLALWILSGVHGEEPAGPNAIARNIDNLGELGQDIPVVIFPLLNPIGYSKNWRYPDERRDWRVGHSVADSEHYLPDLKDPSRPRVALPGSEFAARVTQFVLDTIIDYPPVLTLDHHEDEQLEFSYIYSQGKKGADDEVAKVVIHFLTESGLPLQMKGRTRFEELIREGIVVDENGEPVKDGSVDELLATDKIIVAGQVVAKASALTALVVETPTTALPLEKRIEAHSNIMRRLRSLWAIANE